MNSILGKELVIACNNNYRDECEAFFKFMKSVFPSCSFREWAEKGFWNRNYIPYSIVQQNKIVSNVCITKMDVILHGKIFKAAQIGGVGTLPQHRGRGHSRKLMEHIIDLHKNSVYLFFLFANDSVLDFYPKFGFKYVEQSIFHFKPDGSHIDKKNDLSKLNLENPHNYNLLLKMLDTRIPLTKIFGAQNYLHITMWHILNFFNDNLYFSESHNSILIMEKIEGTIKIFDVISTKIYNFERLANSLMENEHDEILCYFPPDQYNYNFKGEKYTINLPFLF